MLNLLKSIKHTWSYKIIKRIHILAFVKRLYMGNGLVLIFAPYLHLISPDS